MWQDPILEQENLHVSLRSARGRERSERNEHIHLRLCVSFRRLECCVPLAFTGLSRHDPMNLPLVMSAGQVYRTSQGL
jgi:hypothetical protein